MVIRRTLPRSTAVLLLPVVLAACAALPAPEVSSRTVPLPQVLPAMKSFPPAPPGKGRPHSNADLARDFLELSFNMESGKRLPRLTRFETPVTVAFDRPQNAQFQADLSDLLGRVRKEAGIDIRQGATGTTANITIFTLPRRILRAAVPKAACFVVPRVHGWREFKRARRNGQLDWSTLKRRERASIFIPSDISPQEARDCLHEEITQALGPLNDIYRLPDSIYNDDNMNAVLTRFDMLILRTYYDPALKNGMSEAAVRRALPAILKRLHPAGEGLASDGISRTPRLWVETLETALSTRSSPAKRLLYARKAVAMAKKNGWQDNRLGFALFVLGRLSLGRDSKTAIASFSRSYALYSRIYGKADIHTAHVALQLSAFALSTGHVADALKLVNANLPTVIDAQNATLLATYLMIKAEALDDLGRHRAAATVRLDSIAWARYGFADLQEIRKRLAETTALKPSLKKLRF